MADVTPLRNGQPERRDRRSLLALLVLLLLLVALYLLVALWFGLWPFVKNAAEQEVITPSIRSFEDLRKYTEGKPLPQPSKGRRVPGLQQDDHIRGDPSTIVTVVLYANMDNPYLPLAIQALNDLLVENDSLMHWVFRHYPLEDHPLDFRAALAAECLSREAGDDVFFAYVEQLLRSKLSTASVTAAANTVLPGSTKFDPCLRGEVLSDYVYIDKQEAQLEGEIFTTPTIVFIKNSTNEQWFVEGLETQEYLQATLEAVLGQS